MPANEAKELWEKVSVQLKTVIGDKSYYEWIDGLEPFAIKEGFIILNATSEFHAIWSTKHYERIINALLQFQDGQLEVYIRSVKAQ